jgi:hypothetical protein
VAAAVALNASADPAVFESALVSTVWSPIRNVVAARGAGRERSAVAANAIAIVRPTARDGLRDTGRH